QRATVRMRLEIGSCTERPALTPKDSHARALVGVERAKGVGEGACCRRVDGVSHLRPRENDGGDWAGLLDSNGLAHDVVARCEATWFARGESPLRTKGG